MATPVQNKVNFNRKYLANNVGSLVGPRTFIVDTSQTPAVNPISTNGGNS